MSKDKIFRELPRYLTNKRKIINDPVYGFININDDLIFDIIEHPWFQRLRRIKQLGLTHLVYPGALHTRFHHSLGAMHLMHEAISVLRSKGIEISEEEIRGALAGILMHDIGHGPFSHALEQALIINASHEQISQVFMEKLNEHYGDRLHTGLNIFNQKTTRRFLSQLISSQLDVDRIDYLTRDSFFTGVSEGVIGTKRIIKMLNVADGNLVAESKGLYSIEKFLIARRLMYWQVYLHKTVIAAEQMLIKILKRAKYLSRNGARLFATPHLQFFLSSDPDVDDFRNDPEIMEHYSKLDDFDVFTSIKVWSEHSDPILSFLCKGLANRKLFRCELSPAPFDYFRTERIRNNIRQLFRIAESDLEYFIYNDTTSNYAYNKDEERIKVVFKDGSVADLLEVSDNLNISVIGKIVTKHILCYPKNALPSQS